MKISPEHANTESKNPKCTCTDCKCDPCECSGIKCCGKSGTCSSTWCNWGAVLRIAIAVFMIIGAFIAGSYYTNCMNQKGCSHHSDDKRRSYDGDTLLITEGPYDRNHTMLMPHNPMSMSMADMGVMLAGKTGSELNKAFLEGMIPHHQGAVEMAKYLEKSDKPELRQMGQDIIKAQTTEIEQMKKWMAEWGYTQTGTTVNTGMTMSGMHMMPDGSMMHN